MKKTTIFLMLLFPFFLSFSQNEEGENGNFFFTTTYDSLDICYGKSLLQPIWDTITEEIIIKEATAKLVLVDSFVLDTIDTDYWMLNHNENLFAIIDFVDTSRVMVEIEEESRRLILPHSYEDNFYETIEMSVMDKEGFHTWINRGKDITNSMNWQPKFTPPVYRKETQLVVKVPGTTREEVVPAHYLSTIAIYPKKDITVSQLEILNKLCKKSYVKKQPRSYYIEVHEPEETIQKDKYILTEKAKTELVIINCLPSAELISQLQKQLYALNLYRGDFLGKFTNKTKEAIILYQMSNDLPIGQLDEKTVAKLLAEKTPFNH